MQIIPILNRRVERLPSLSFKKCLCQFNWANVVDQLIFFFALYCVARKFTPDKMRGNLRWNEKIMLKIKTETQQSQEKITKILKIAEKMYQHAQLCWT